MNVILPFKSVIEIEIREVLRAKDFGTGLIAGVFPKGKVEAFAVLKEPRKIWILVCGGNRLQGLPRRDWLRHWHEERIQIRKRRGKEWREYFNDKLKRDQL